MGSDDPTHVYWDLENRRSLWSTGEAMHYRVTDEEMVEIRNERLELTRLRQRVEELEQQRVEGVVALCVCENAATPRPGCDCVTCTVKRADQRAEAAEAKLARVVEALEEIGWADPYKGNIIDTMKQTALDALAAAKGGE